MLKLQDRKLYSILFIVLLLCGTILTGCDDSSSTQQSQTRDESEEATIPSEPLPPYEYDSLQTIFLTISPDTTIGDLEALITNHALCYTSREYNKSGGGKEISYKIAYTDGTAKQSHADSGDYLDIDFDLENNGKLMTAQYAKSGSVGTALLYCYGTWFSFSDSNAEDYSGYYLINHSYKEPGIVIKYKNGNEVETSYFPYETAEETLRCVIDASH